MSILPACPTTAEQLKGILSDSPRRHLTEDDVPKYARLGLLGEASAASFPSGACLLYFRLRSRQHFA
eukprot:375916-Pelagomonas_calceolata.AAC.2